MKQLLVLTLLAASIVSHAAGAAEKTVYAHYMGCFPAGYAATEHHRQNMVKTLKHDSKNYVDAMGGNIVNWPLTPHDMMLTAEQSAELEIKRAMRGGIDGFAIDAWAGGEGAQRVLDQLFAAAERMKAPFKITICMDPSCLPKNEKEPGNNIQAYADAIKYVLDRHGSSPNLARRNGKPLIFGYHSRGIYRPASVKDMPEGTEKWDRTAQAYREVEKLLGQPIFFHFCIDAFFHNAPKQEPGMIVKAAEWAGRNFGAVGGFIGDEWAVQDKNMASAVKAGAAEWSQPMWFQYNNKAGALNVAKGLDILRRNWDSARQNDATLIQFVTWNDYGEDTILAPGYSTGYTILELNRYYVDWWKQGKEPVPKEDSVHLIFRRYINGAATYPFQMRRSAPGVLEVVTILKAPAEVAIPGNKEKYQAPAGIFFKQFPLQVGPVTANISRNGKQVLTATAPELITDKPFREDNSMVCFSNDFDAQWKTDFGDVPPLYYSEYGDIDHDGLPNWFEMYWFGKFPDLRTAAVAKPDDKPANDGVSNLQKYNKQQNPLQAEIKYQAGYVWDIDAVHKRGVSFNPDVDGNGTPVWYYLYKHGERGQTPHDGDYQLCPHSGQKVQYAGDMAQLSPSQDPKYKYIHGWISRSKAADGHWLLNFKPRVQVVIVLGWKSPVDGVVDIKAKILPVTGQDGVTLDIGLGKESIFKQVYEVGKGGDIDLPGVSVKRGEFIYFVTDEMPGFDASSLVMDSLQLKLVKVE
ncbi:MAG: endo-1,3-alpha-glucanase family glycosylhydrolase [Victivallales bacterium]|jgi:hypothetical protein